MAKVVHRIGCGSWYSNHKRHLIFRWLCYKAMILKFVPKSWARLYKSKSDLKLINQIGSFFSVAIPSHLLCKMQCHKGTDINQLKVAKFQKISSSASKLIKTYTKSCPHFSNLNFVTFSHLEICSKAASLKFNKGDFRA